MPKRKKTKGEKIRVSLEKIKELSNILANSNIKFNDPEYKAHTLKKLIVLAKYLPFFVNVLKGKTNTVYIDLLAGSGAVKIAYEYGIFPGSALIGYTLPFISTFNVPPFDFHIFVELEEDKVNILHRRIELVKEKLNLNSPYMIFQDNCNNVIEAIYEILRAKFGNRFKVFMFIDPEGYEEVKWETIEKTLKTFPGDFLILFNTRYIKRTSKSGPNALASFLGESVEWVKKNIKTNKQALDHFMNKLARIKPPITTKNTLPHYIVKSIQVDAYINGQNMGRYYDLVFISSYEIGTKVFERIKETIEGVRTERIPHMLNVIFQREAVLDNYFP